VAGGWCFFFQASAPLESQRAEHNKRTTPVSISIDHSMRVQAELPAALEVRNARVVEDTSTPSASDAALAAPQEEEGLAIEEVDMECEELSPSEPAAPAAAPVSATQPFATAPAATAAAAAAAPKYVTVRAATVATSSTVAYNAPPVAYNTVPAAGYSTDPYAAYGYAQYGYAAPYAYAAPVVVAEDVPLPPEDDAEEPVAPPPPEDEGDGDAPPPLPPPELGEGDAPPMVSSLSTEALAEWGADASDGLAASSSVGSEWGAVEKARAQRRKEKEMERERRKREKEAERESRAKEKEAEKKRKRAAKAQVGVVGGGSSRVRAGVGGLLDKWNKVKQEVQQEQRRDSDDSDDDHADGKGDVPSAKHARAAAEDGGGATVAARLMAANRGLPHGWQAFMDEASQDVYYGNLETHATSWERPS
jgi:hypothetical protein